MSGPELVLVAVGSALGAPLRHLADVLVRPRGVLVRGTFVVNVAGSLVLGALTAGLDHAGLPAGWGLLVGTGFCGALTTFSTFGVETVRLVEDEQWRAAALYAGASVAVGLAAAAVGYGGVAAVAAMA